MIMERTCKECGKTMPLEMFPKEGIYYRYICKECTNAKKRLWRKNHVRSEEEKTKDNLRCALKREKLKADTGRTYRNVRDAEKTRAYAIQYEKDHKDDPKHKETKRKCGRNAWQRKKIREEVEILSEFFSDDNIF
jgi:hypothetical protein